MHHFDRAAGQTEGHGPERTCLGPVHHRVVTGGDEAFFEDAFNHFYSRAQSRDSFPVQCTDLPGVDEAYEQVDQEHHAGPETGRADVGQSDRPGHKERDFEVEQDEEDGDQVIRTSNFMRASSKASKPHS